MKANELLLWLSARVEGSWRAFRAAVEKLQVAEDLEMNGGREFEYDHFPLHQQLRLNMERLGHVEFRARGCEDGWRVVPPTLATTRESNGWIGVLCGARSDPLLEHFVRMTSHLQAEVIPQADAPDVYRVFASDREELSKLCEQSSLLFQSDAPLAILSYLPPADPLPRNGPTVEFPQGADWVIHKFLPDTLGWRKVSRADANSACTGFFRFMIYFQRPRYFLRQWGHIFELPRAVGIYALLRRRRRNVLRYDGNSRSLILPAVCQPPRLLERALVLCSGLPPTFDAHQWRLTYAQVPEDIAQLAARLLRQDLS